MIDIFEKFFMYYLLTMFLLVVILNALTFIGKTKLKYLDKDLYTSSGELNLLNESIRPSYLYLKFLIRKKYTSLNNKEITTIFNSCRILFITTSIMLFIAIFIIITNLTLIDYQSNQPWR